MTNRRFELGDRVWVREFIGGLGITVLVETSITGVLWRSNGTILGYRTAAMPTETAVIYERNCFQYAEQGVDAIEKGA